MAKRLDASTPEESQLVPIYIPSFGIETWPIKSNGKIQKFVKGSVNGIPFEVECDKQVEVTAEIAEVLQPLIEKQAGRTV